jgi:hypothetical protein
MIDVHESAIRRDEWPANRGWGLSRVARNRRMAVNDAAARKTPEPYPCTSPTTSTRSLTAAPRPE